MKHMILAFVLLVCAFFGLSPAWGATHEEISKASQLSAEGRDVLNSDGCVISYYDENEGAMRIPCKEWLELQNKKPSQENAESLDR